MPCHIEHRLGKIRRSHPWVLLTPLAALVLVCCSQPRRPLAVVVSPSETWAATAAKATDMPSANPTTPASATAMPAPTALPQPTLTPTRTPAATPSPILQPAATGTQTPELPTIAYFRSGTDIADAGGTIELVWESTGATSAELYKLMVSGQLPAHGIGVATSGTYVYTIPLEEQNWISFLLYVWDDSGHHADATVTVRLRCSHDWFFDPPPEDICPTAPLVSPAAEQHFENGTMIWVEAEDAVYVLHGAPLSTTRWTRLEDLWEEGMPEQVPDLTPPQGLHQPIRGFGLVWQTHPEIREQLGWALSGESGYTTTVQRTTRYKYNAWYLLAQDGGIWHLGPEHSSWTKLPPSGEH